MELALGQEALYTAEQTRALDRCAIDTHGVPGIRLMGRAAQACLDVLLDVWPEPDRITVMCGYGNNGGDGYLLARLAHQRGLVVQVLQVGDSQRLSGDAAQANALAAQEGVAISPWAGEPLSGVVVDALLGTGLNSDVREPFRAAIEAINASGRPVVAVDIPSGLCSDTGVVRGAAVRADITVSFIGLKRGLFTAQAPSHCGAIHFTDLAVPAEIYDSVRPEAWRLDLESLFSLLPPRDACAHKGYFGHVLVIGGDTGMAGAACLAAEAAARCGAGLVSVATRPAHIPALAARCPEVMAHPIEFSAELEPLLAKADVLVVGPGLGQSPWSEQLLQRALATDKAMVLDADGLNLLAAMSANVAPRSNWVLTPHPGEAGRLLGQSVPDLQADRFAAAQKLRDQFGGTVLLKGAGTVLATEQGLFLSDYGNPGMASGGMGDVLSGVIGAQLAQGLNTAQAACLGACLHGAAADRAAPGGQRGLLARDLMPHLRRLLG